MITAERARERLSYDPETGALTWRSLSKMANKKFKVGCPAGYWTGKHPKRLTIEIDGTSYQAHRLAWLIHYGEMPSKWIDHKDGDCANNRIANLRLATPAENTRNRKVNKNSGSGIKGVHWRVQRQKWQARISIGGKTIYLGHYDTPEEARAAYNAAAPRIHGEFARAA